MHCQDEHAGKTNASGEIDGLLRVCKMILPPSHRIEHRGDGARTRRNLLRQMACISMSLPLAHANALPFLAEVVAQSNRTPTHIHPTAPPAPTSLSAQDEQFLNGLEHSNFLYFWEQANPQTGLVRDRCNVRTKETSIVSSVASTGFGLTAICIGDL